MRAEEVLRPPAQRRLRRTFAIVLGRTPIATATGVPLATRLPAAGPCERTTTSFVTISGAPALPEYVGLQTSPARRTSRSPRAIELWVTRGTVTSGRGFVSCAGGEVP